MTGQDGLNYMELLLPELQLQSGESDVVKGLRALNAAQDYFEVIAARAPGVLGGSIGTVVTTLSTESTAYPAGLLRVDRLQFIDPDTSRPAWNLAPLYDAGGHAPSNYFPFNITSATANGRPTAYWTDGSNIYWDPLPSGAHTVRYYGFKSASDITAAGTFVYPDAVMLPLATFACKLMRIGLDDPVESLQSLAQETFQPVISALESFRREQPRSLTYKYSHDT